MAERKIPTIKGMLIKDQLARLRKLGGEAAMKELGKRFPKSLDFSALTDYPTSDEEDLVKVCVQIVKKKALHGRELDLQAGEYHWLAFAETSYAQILINFAKGHLKQTFAMIPKVVTSIHKNMTFEIIELEEKKVKVIVKNSGYSIYHYEGYFYAFMKSLGMTGTVIPKIIKDFDFEYTVEWK